MLDLHKQKQAEANSFLDWLEQEAGSTAGDWSLKTLVQAYWEQPWGEIERALCRNKSRFIQTQGLRGKDAERALAPLLRATRGHWEASCARLQPILAAIQATDRVIDLLVYRLYGLTDDEIDLVEGVGS